MELKSISSGLGNDQKSKKVKGQSSLKGCVKSV